MKIVHVSFRRAAPGYSDPQKWIRFLSFFAGVLEYLSQYAEVTAIYHIDYRGSLSHKGVRYHFPRLREWQLIIPLALNAFIRNQRPDVVVVHGLIFPWQVLMLRWQLPKSVTIIAQHHSERPLRHIRRFFQRFADRCIAKYLFASFEFGQQWVEEGLIADESKIREVMVGSSAFPEMPKSDARRFTGVVGERVFLWVGRLDANKDPVTVVRAFVTFAGANPGVRLYMIFQTDDLLDELNHILSHATHGRTVVELVGRVEHEHLGYWYNSADYFLSGSFYEGAGIAVCESMSCGCIPVLTDIPSFRMMTDRGRLGVLYPAGDQNALLAALKKATALDIAAERKAVREWFKGELSFEAIGDKMISIINEAKAQS